MAMTNGEVARVLERVGHVLEIRGENPFKARAYYSAARVIDRLGRDVNKIVADGELPGLPGFGGALTEKVTQLVTTGHMDYLDEIIEGLPPGILTLMDVRDVGPKKIKLFYDSLGVGTITQLETAARQGKLAGLAGMGEKSQAKIVESIRQYRSHQGRWLISQALGLAERVLGEVEKFDGLERASLAGSVRRRRETAGNVDIVVSAGDGAALAKAFGALEGVERVLAAGDAKVSAVFSPGIQVDLRVVDEKSYAAARRYYTGSVQHNVRMRRLAEDAGRTLDEHGLFEGGKMLPAKDEAELFAHFGMAWVPPELREDTGEVEAALGDDLPELVELKDVKGLVHVHTNWSDGKMSIERLVAETKKRGFSYLVVADHSKAVAVANGLSEERILEQWREIDRLQGETDGVKIFRGIEVDIKRDGSLDYADEVLAGFDCCIAAVHSSFTMGTEKMTARIVKAVSNPYVDVLAHPTGRLLLERDPYAVDVDAVLAACAESDVAVEINSHPLRLDLDWRCVRKAADMGLKIAVDLDAHDPADLDYLRFGVSVARRGWLGAGDVLNCLCAARFKEWIDRRRTQKGC